MKKKIKMIELLNKMNNQEELPRKIQYGIDDNNCPAIWRLMVGSRDYCCDEIDTMNNYLFRDYIGDITVVLNNEVEILEDNTEEIEEIKEISDEYFNMLSDESKVKWLKSYIKEDKNKINELVKAVNKLRKENKK